MSIRLDALITTVMGLALIVHAVLYFSFDGPRQPNPATGQVVGWSFGRHPYYVTADQFQALAWTGGFFMLCFLALIFLGHKAQRALGD